MFFSVLQRATGQRPAWGIITGIHPVKLLRQKSDEMGEEAAVRLFRGPVKLALRVLVNSALGFGAVWLLNLTAAVTGIRLGLNVFNALFIGVLGVPGFGLLLLLQWVLA